MYRLLNIWHPERYHNWLRQPPFFEGWFFKLVTQSRNRVLAIIPGIFLQGDYTDHAFIQVLDESHRTVYIRFPASSFESSKNRFDVRIGANRFTHKSMELDLTHPHIRLYGKVSFSSFNPWPVRLLSPGAMGWYAFVPKMECYHGVVSFDHHLFGCIKIDSYSIDFTKGRGYIEKDWGRSFPLAYVWLQSNHFQRSGISLMTSIARIPWRQSFFRGFLVGFLIDGKFHRWTSYTGATLESLRISDQAVSIYVTKHPYRLEIEAMRTTGGLLHGPDGRQMYHHISETLTSEVTIRFTSCSKGKTKILFEGRGYPAGLDVNGPVEELTIPSH